MSYQSPIDVIMGQMNISYENEICKAVQNVGVNVDKNELMKALQYDRGQYQKGYADRDAEIIRCKDCKYAFQHWNDLYRCDNHCNHLNGYGEHHGHWFCGDGKRRTDDD